MCGLRRDCHRRSWTAEGLALEDPADFAARAFLGMLRQRGIAVTGTAKPRHRDSVDAEGLRKEQEEP